MELTVARRGERVGLFGRASVQENLWVALCTFICLVGAVVMLFPVYFMVITSLKSSGGAFLLPIKWLPGIEYIPIWKNYPESLNFMQWNVVYRNTTLIAASNMVGDTLSACLVAYGFARFRAPGRTILF